MKKMMTLGMGILMALCMTACRTHEVPMESAAESSTVLIQDEEISYEANAEEPVSEENTEESVSEENAEAPVPDGNYSVNLENERIIYDNNGITITYTGIAFNVGLSDEFYFKVENNTENAICVMPNSIVLNGISFSVGNSMVTPAHTSGEIIVGIMSNDREGLLASMEDIQCFDMTFSIMMDANEYGTSGTPGVNGETFVFTDGQHDHRNDNRIIKGDLIYENEEVELYVEKNYVKEGDKLYSNFTVVNKTSEPIVYAGRAECRYEVAPVMPHFAMIEGMYAHLSPYSYYTGSFCFDDEHNTLAMNEIIFTLSGYKATQMDQTLAYADEDLTKCDFHDTHISVTDLTIEK